MESRNYSEAQVLRSHNNQTETVTDHVAEETPIALTYHGIPQVVMMATPDHLEDLAVGFTVTESIVANADEILSVQAKMTSDSAQVDIAITSERFSELLRRQRNLTGRTGCGVCGVETIEQAIRKPAQVTSDVRVSADTIHSALRALSAKQELNKVVGSVHAAAWISCSVIPAQAGIHLQVMDPHLREDDDNMIVREDVGRHNALDKVIGSLLRNQVDPATGFLLITSRASYEMVLKAATVGVSLLIAVSAPTALAIKLADECGMTLVGFARDESHVIYTHAERIRSE